MNASFSIGGYIKSALGIELGQKIGKEYFQIIRESSYALLRALKSSREL